MVYIHVKRAGNKKYYTLRLSVRKGGKVITKDLENLGSNLSKINLDNLEKKYSKEIKKSYQTLRKFLESNHYLEEVKKKKLKKNLFFTKEKLEEIEAISLHFNKKFKKHHQLTQKDVYQYFLIKFAVSSTAIEGNTISLQEAGKLLREDITPKNKTLREIYDLKNTQKVFFDLLEKKPKLSSKLIEQVHDNLLNNIDTRKGYRVHDIRIFGQPFKPSKGKYVNADMKLLLDWYRKKKQRMHPLALAIFFHHKFENIHPFSDGNGRTGRILMNLILIKHGYPPFLVPVKFRNEYINVISEADEAIKRDLLSVKMEHHQSLFSFLIDQYILTYWNTFLI